MTTIHDLLAEYTRIAPNTRAKGLYFERLVKRYLETEPIYTGLLDEVWLWQDWPGRDGKVDTGIDLVAREKYTLLCAPQPAEQPECSETAHQTPKRAL